MARDYRRYRRRLCKSEPRPPNSVRCLVIFRRVSRLFTPRPTAVLAARQPRGKIHTSECMHACRRAGRQASGQARGSARTREVAFAYTCIGRCLFEPGEVESGSRFLPRSSAVSFRLFPFANERVRGEMLRHRWNVARKGRRRVFASANE